MIGYFNNLAIRTVSHGNPGQGNLVQPRTASAFEPQGVMESPVESGGRSLATDHTEEKRLIASNPLKNSAPATRLFSDPYQNDVTIETSSEPSVVSEPTVSNEEPALPTFEAAPQHREPETRVPQAAPVAALSTRVNEVVLHEDARTVELPQVVKTAVAKTTIQKITAPQTQQLQPQAEDVSHAAQPERSVSPLIKNRIHKTETLRSAHHFTERLTEQSQWTPHTQATQQTIKTKQTTTRREQVFLESPTEPEPSINITIGRVEVRATPTNAQKQKPTRTASPVMPLEEYLRKQRRGDER